MEEVEKVLTRYLSLVKQMREKEARLLEIYKKNGLESYYHGEVAELLVKLNKLNSTIEKMASKYYIVGGVK